MLMRIVPDLTTPSWEGLSYLLRHRELWPKDFEWNFARSGSCAIGLSHKVMGDYPMAKFPSPNPYAHSTYSPCLVNEVTPEMVADKIDELLPVMFGVSG